ncbi:hypothetical protein CRG98_027812 [Punica granatum]|uniref:Uncharacterized protein n=1 Tax=Punica granatum TaxID=22663 RepID=A0A2I0J6B0_PUNGR|nr:hypothetical protein CRG98_027812 [Punica granatum]
MDYALREEEPHAPTDTNAPEVKEKYEWWEKSNRLILMLMKSREEMMKQDKPEVAHLATRPKGKGKKDHGKRQYKVLPKMDGSKGFLNLRNPTESERFVYSGNKRCSQGVGVGIFRIILSSGYALD